MTCQRFIQHTRLHTNASFSTDLNVALKFRGDSGMIIGMNMKRTFNHPFMLDCVDATRRERGWFKNKNMSKFDQKKRKYTMDCVC